MENLYDKILNNEKEVSKIFLQKIKISQKKIDENDYAHVKNICSNTDLIEKICKTISEVCDFEKKSILLILTDFLFSITSYGMKDPANLIFKTTRSDYINNIRLRAIINSTFGYEPLNYINIHRKLIIALKVKEIIKKYDIRILENTKWSTVVYLKLEIKNNNNYDIHLGFSKEPFIISNIGGSWYTVGSFRNIWILKRKKKEMEDFKIDHNSVKKSNKLKLVLSKEIYKINKENIENEKNSILKKINCKNLDEYFIEIKKLLNKDIFLNKKELNKEYTTLLSQFQKIISFQILEREIFDKLMYLPCFIDNRGRQYFATLISPTFHKMFRYLYKFYEKKEFIDLENSEYYKRIIKYEENVKEFSLNNKNSYILIVLFLEIGKFFLKDNKNYLIKTEEIIKIGKINHKLRSKSDFNDSLYLEKIYILIDKLIMGLPIDINSIIFKDATSSGLQNYGIILGYQEEKLKYINLNGEDWCDTYKYIIDKFLETNDESLKKRKYWKKTIMTIPYNSVWYSCYTGFLEKIREDGMYNEDHKEEIKTIHKKFYYSVKNKIKEELYIKLEGDLEKFTYNKWTIVNKKEYKITYKKERDKYTDILFMLDEDKVATKNALEANNMHYLDSKLMSFVMEKYNILPVHDCFGIRLCEVHLVIDLINHYYSSVIGKKTYSIHVII